MKHSIYFSLKTFFLGVIALSFMQVRALSQEVHLPAAISNPQGQQVLTTRTFNK
jgi:hypothetical protein